MSELVKKLANGKHPVAAQAYKTVSELKAALDRGFVLIKFTETKGGTELGVRLDSSKSDLSKGDFQSSKGSVRIAGNLTLDYVGVCMVADINLENLKGTGCLEVLDAK